jgi:hypothetical protein
MSINLKNQEGFIEIFSVFSGLARYFNTEYLTFSHNQKSILIRCELYKDAAEKAYRQYKYFSLIEIKSTVNWETSEGFKPVLQGSGVAVKT